MSSENPPSNVPGPIDGGTIPLSFPSILRNPGISDRFGYLSSVKPNNTVPIVAKRNRRDDKEGKRWIRRQENGQSSILLRAEFERCELQLGSSAILMSSKRRKRITFCSQQLPNKHFQSLCLHIFPEIQKSLMA